MTRCWPWSHRWTKWRPDKMEAVSYATWNNSGVDVTIFWQERRCEVCGKVQQERLGHPASKQG